MPNVILSVTRLGIALAVVTLILSAPAIVGHSASATNHQTVCDKSPCVIVRVDSVSYDNSGAIINLTVSSTQATYQLTCNREQKNCNAPALGTKYQFTTVGGEKPAALDDSEGEYPRHGKTAFLKSGNVIAGRYWEVAHIPISSKGEIQNLIKDCKAKDALLKYNDCAKWVAKRAWARTASCPDSEASSACHSFHELLTAGDPDLMDSFADMRHVYICFRPKEDVFMSVMFPDPSDPDPYSSLASSWRKADADDRKVWGFVNGTLIQREIAGPEVQYYKNGISDENAAIGAIGYWSYLPSKFSTISDATFAGEGINRGQNIKISRERFVASVTYKNQDDKQIEHTLILQRSTGRFSERYNALPSGNTILSYSGGCLVVPDATY